MRKRNGNYSKKLLPSINNNSVGANIQKLRRQQNIKQEIFAKSIGVSRVALSKYENGIWNVPIDIMLSAAAELNVHHNILLEEKR